MDRPVEARRLPLISTVVCFIPGHGRRSDIELGSDYLKSCQFSSWRPTKYDIQQFENRGRKSSVDILYSGDGKPACLHRYSGRLSERSRKRLRRFGKTLSSRLQCLMINDL